MGYCSTVNLCTSPPFQPRGDQVERLCLPLPPGWRADSRRGKLIHRQHQAPHSNTNPWRGTRDPHDSYPPQRHGHHVAGAASPFHIGQCRQPHVVPVAVQDASCGFDSFATLLYDTSVTISSAQFRAVVFQGASELVRDQGVRMVIHHMRMASIAHPPSGGMARLAHNTRCPRARPPCWLAAGRRLTRDTQHRNPL